MPDPRKNAQLQIRVTHAEKAALQRAARRAGMDLSSYVLGRACPAAAADFARCLARCSDLESSRFALAELNALLSGLAPGELADAVREAPPRGMSAQLENYVAAMVEQACANADIPLPAWTAGVQPLDQPLFGSALHSLRLHLLTHAPAAFRRRNLFIDTTLGAQV